MRSRSLALLLVLLAPSLASRADAATRTFAANSLIIPMDYCYQTAKSKINLSPLPGYCGNMTGGNAADGILLAYGLVYRLVQNGITVYVMLNPTKAAMNDIDMTVTAPSGSPVLNVTTSTGATTDFLLSGSTINYRGMPFVIDASQHDAALALLKSNATFNPTFNPVVVHVAKQSFQAPVKLVLSQTPPKVALLNLGGAAGGVLTSYLGAAGLNVAGAGGIYGTSSGTIYDEFDKDTDFTGGGLVSGGYKILWAPHWDGDANQNAVYQSISTFIDQGGAFFSECASVHTEEGEFDNSGKPQGGGAAQYMTTGGIYKLSVPGSFPSAGESWFNGDLQNVLVQHGDFGFVAQGGSVPAWQPAASTASVYRSGVVRLIGTTSPTPANNNIDVFTFTRKDNDPNKGIVVYLGGHSYSGAVSGTRLVLNSLLLSGQAFVSSVELARSSPIAYSDQTTFQGTYMSGNAATAFPPVLGHFRQYAAGALSGANVTGFATPTANWDTGNGGIPAAGSRTVFTVNAGAKTAFTAANAATLSGAMGMTQAAATTAINGILAGNLGGIDHSTPAIIGPSTVAGSSTRPTVAYVGALDGMLHAIAVSGGGLTVGQEMWAFIPPSQLGKIGTYQAGVDGSPAVADVFIDPTSSGVRTWRTVLAVTNGAYGGTVDLLDVTDPTTPTWLWTASNTNGNYSMGAAMGAAFGMIASPSGPESVLYVATNNAGTAGNGFNLYAIDVGSHAVVWQWDHLYSRYIPGTMTLVPNDVPPVPSVINTAGDGGADNRVYYGDLDGRIWEIDAAAGTPPSEALWDAGADGFPITSGVAIYRDVATQHISVVAGTGGKDWVAANSVQQVVSVDAQHYQSGNSGAGTVLFTQALTAGERVYAAPTISGNDVYVITSFGNFSGNISGSTSDGGNIRRFNLSGKASFSFAVKKGDSEIAVDSQGNIIGASAAGETQNSNANADGAGLSLSFKSRPMTVQAWLDLH